jgi:hypothetical protein
VSNTSAYDPILPLMLLVAVLGLRVKARKKHEVLVDHARLDTLE